MDDEIKIPVKLILYKDMIDNNYTKIVPVDKAEEVIVNLILDGYMDVSIAWGGTPYEIMWYLGSEKT